MEALAGFSVSGRFPRLVVRSPSPTPSTSSSSSTRSISRRRRLGLSFLRASASRDDGRKLDKWDQMELEFGRFLGEDPKLTIAKIMARKSDPDVSYLEVEKEFRKNKGKLDDSMIDVTEDFGLGALGSRMMKSKSQVGNLNLSRPALGKGIKAMKPDARPGFNEEQTSQLVRDSGKTGEVSSIPLRKPAIFEEDDLEMDSRAKLKIKPNLFLKMRKNSSEKLSDSTLLRKPEVMKISLKPNQENVPSGDSVGLNSSEAEPPLNGELGTGDVPEVSVGDIQDPFEGSALQGMSSMANNVIGGSADENSGPEASGGEMQNSVDSSAFVGMPSMANDVVGGPSDKNRDPLTRLSARGPQPPERWGIESSENQASITSWDSNSVNYISITSSSASLLGKPQRLQPYVKEAASNGKEETSLNGEDFELKNEDFISDEEEKEDNDWSRAEHLYNTGEREEVELVSCSSRGFVVTFGSLVGFLPYRNLGAKWKFLAFESWLRKNGLDPSLYRRNLGIPGSADVHAKNLASKSDKVQDMEEKDNEPLPPNMKFEDLLETYDQEKTKFLSSFIGQRIRVTVVLADRRSKKLMLSGRPKEKEEVVEKKRSLMAKLSVGDIVKCSIKRITYFGIFVKVEEVPALIPQSEVSWDAALDPSAFFKVGQTLDAKVLQLDYGLERITLSLKEIMPDPLAEALESVVDDNTSLEGRLKVSQAAAEWSDVDMLIKELQKIDGIDTVSKGRFFLSPGLAPTFQVYMTSMFDNQYKLLARNGNKVQEVIVQTSMGKEEMKAAILTCTIRVE